MGCRREKSEAFISLHKLLCLFPINDFPLHPVLDKELSLIKVEFVIVISEQ